MQRQFTTEALKKFQVSNENSVALYTFATEDTESF